MWVKGVRCQQFNKAGSLGRLFEVQPPDVGQNAVNGPKPEQDEDGEGLARQ